MNLTRFIIAAALGIVLTGCGLETTVSATFNAASGLEAGTPVYLGDILVGEVSDVTTTGETAKAELSLDPELVESLRTGSAALFTSRSGEAVVELYNYRSGKEPLQSGGEMVGLNNTLEYAAWRAGESLDAGRQSMDEMAKSIKDYFDSEEWQQHKERMNRQLADLKEELGRTYEDTNEAYQEFLEDLESESEAARERARESYDELVKRLQEQIARLKEQGNEQIVEPLQRLLDELSRAMQRKPEQQSV